MRSEKDIRDMLALYAAACDDGTAVDHRHCDAVRRALAWVLGDAVLDVPEIDEDVDDDFDDIMDDDDEEEEDEDGDEEDEDELEEDEW